MNCFADEMKNNNEILANKAEKETKKSKVGQDKLVDFILKMILNAPEPIPEDMTDVNGDPITSRGELVESYRICWSALLWGRCVNTCNIT